MNWGMRAEILQVDQAPARMSSAILADSLVVSEQKTYLSVVTRILQKYLRLKSVI
ncbi:hypothetical protein RIVM261_075390 [Rivularia sp. IAM M-261]|nr:hypothetical protein RIVM261_075390 [Rivularia sp. IAM M-261]